MNKLMMKLLIGSEGVFFISLMLTYLYFWRSGQFNKGGQYLHIQSGSLMTIVLISSSFTLLAAERNYLKGRIAKTKAWLMATVLLGVVFLAGQGHEYYQLLKKNLTIGGTEFGSSFYTLTALHGLHVLIGLIILLIVLLLMHQGYFNNGKSSALSTAGLYWHFIDVVWLFVFTIIYVLPYLI